MPTNNNIIIQSEENSNYCMGVTQASTNNTVVLCLIGGAGDTLTQWQLDSSTGHIMLVADPNLFLDIQGTVNQGSQLIVTSLLLGRQSQSWNWLGNPPYIVNDAASGMVVDNKGSNLVQGNPLIIWPQNQGGSPNQKWTLLPVGGRWQPESDKNLSRAQRIPMTNVQLQNIIFSDVARIAASISTGAAWEVWMQVELAILLRTNNLQSAREVPYPAPYQSLRLDILAQDVTGSYAIELKVESATNAGAALLVGVNEDRMKIAAYTPNPGVRWVVGMGYSAAAVNALQMFAAVPGNNAIFAIQGGIAVLVATV